MKIIVPILLSNLTMHQEDLKCLRDQQEVPNLIQTQNDDGLGEMKAIVSLEKVVSRPNRI